MLRIIIPKSEFYDRVSETFVDLPEIELKMEHSLISMSKWESRWMKPFLSKVDKTDEETLDYMKCMIIGDDVIDDATLSRLSNDNVKMIGEYIQSPMTATTIKSDGVNNREVLTSELIYYWMIALNIPFECQYWHLNRLMTLVSVCNIKSQPAKKMSQKDLMARNRKLNADRRKALNTSG